ncbi:MAG TPA: hypothetical protein DDW97_05245 [Anaerolineaceae bacterium]|nr:hypothetical protein [Anaerolineaceae bacterium]
MKNKPKEYNSANHYGGIIPMKTYRLDPAKLPQQKNTILKVYGITFLVLVAISVALNWGQETMRSLLWMIPLIAILFVYSGNRAYKQRKELWENYSLELYDDYLIQNQPRYPELRLNKSDLLSATEKKYGMLISAKQGKDILVITNFLPDEDYQEVVQTLKGWIAENQAAAQAEAPAPEETPLLEVEQQPEEPEPEEEILQADEPEDEQ